MDRLVLIDGNSIANRAFYGIMGSKMLMSKDGEVCTNAIYGFLSILFKIIDDLKPKYLVVTFDLKAPTARHIMYDKYKANRKGMPDELRAQMPIIKEILRAMNIQIVEKEGYEADDVMGTLSKYGEENNLNVTILSGDRDTFQLATDKVTIRIPRTKAGKTETEEFNRNKIIETYGIEPKQLIEVKGLQGDTGDNIPGVPGVGEKSALNLVKEYGTIDNLYEQVEKGLDNLKGKQKENIINNKELAILSRTLGLINLEVPIENKLEDFLIEPWDMLKVFELFTKLNLSKYIAKFNLKEICGNLDNGNNSQDNEGIENSNRSNLKKNIKYSELDLKELVKILSTKKEFTFYFTIKESLDEGLIIKEKITGINVCITEENDSEQLKLIYSKVNKDNILMLKDIFENEDIKKIGSDLTKIYILLMQSNIEFKAIFFDILIAAYILDPLDNKQNIEKLVNIYLDSDLEDKIEKVNSDYGEVEENQIDLFQLVDIEDKKNIDENENTKKDEEKNKLLGNIFVEAIYSIKEETSKRLKKDELYDLFTNVDMPTIEVLSNMQWNGMYVDILELDTFGKELKGKIEILTKEIYNLIGEEFNINSPKQLGEILFEKLKLPVVKKTKTGYSTDVDVLEKLRKEHPAIEKLLEYRQVVKLNSTYVEGLKQYINPKTNRIHSFFHQTITATGRISSTEPNLQNIPTRFELGKRVRKMFKPKDGYVYIDADYSQIELRVLAHISNDIHMINAFNNNEDIHMQAASKVFKVDLEEVTKEQRSSAKAVNFGIVYGISDFGLAEQLGVTRKVAKQYIEEYLEQYDGIKMFMDDIKNEAKENGYVSTLFGRRRYIPEIKSTNFNVRQFGNRVAMNTPIQGTAADIMKIAMINVLKSIKENNLKAKVVLQVHDEMMIEAPNEEKERVEIIIKEEMEKVIKLNVPLIADVSVSDNWYECK